MITIVFTILKHTIGLRVSPEEEITGLDDVTDSFVFHAGTAVKDGKLVTNGGRVLGVTATAPTLDEAIQKAYADVKKIHFDKAHYRTDIGVK